ncbi:MAG: hypothetical protein P3W93_008075 [Thermus sp.]|nr:hypothetical protein [Thermus sp.]
MPRLVAIEAPSGYGKSTYLASLGGAWVALLPGESTPEVLLRLVHRALLGHPPRETTAPSMVRALLDALGGQKVLLAVDDVHHLSPEAADYLLALLQAPGLTLYIAGRDLGHLRALPSLIASGMAALLGPDDLVAITGRPPGPSPQEVEYRLDAMPADERAALISLAGLPFWREEELEARGLSGYLLVAVHGLPVLRQKGVYWPHEILQEALVAQAAPGQLLQNAARLADHQPNLAIPLYLQANAFHEVIRLCEGRVEAWIANSQWDEVLGFLGNVPEEHLGPLAGLVALARLEMGQVTGALRIAHKHPQDPLAIITLALHAYRAGRFGESQVLAERARYVAAKRIDALLAKRVLLAARLALGHPREELLPAAKALLKEAEPWPSQHLGVLSFFLSISPSPSPALAESGFRKSLELGLPHRAVSFLMVWLEAYLQLAEKGQGDATPLQQAIQEVLSYGRLGVPLATVYGHLAEGAFLAYQGELERATEALTAARFHAAEKEIWDVWYSATQVLAEVRYAQGDLQAVDTLVAEMDQVVEVRDLVPMHLVYKALLRLRQGEAGEAYRLLAQAKDLPGESGATARVLLGLAVNPEEVGGWFALSCRLLGLSAVPRVVSLRDQALYANGVQLHLSPKELVYLLALMLGPGTTAEISERVYGNPDSAQAVHTTISRLRSKGVPGLTARGRRYVLEGYRLDLALRIEAARQLPQLLQGLDLEALPSDQPVWEEWRERLKAMAKAVALEWARRGVFIPGVHLLDPEDPDYLEALGQREALYALQQGERWA